jgi:hypothetical protein
MPTNRPYIFLTCDSKHTYIIFLASMIYHTRGKYFNLYTTDEEVELTKIHLVADGLYLTVIIKYFYSDSGISFSKFPVK